VLFRVEQAALLPGQHTHAKPASHEDETPQANRASHEEGTPQSVPGLDEEALIRSPLRPSCEAGFVQNLVNEPRRSSSSETEEIDDAELLGKLRDAAGGRLGPRCADLLPVRRLLSEGCDLDEDILPFVRERVPKLREPLGSFAAPWFAAEIKAGATARLASTVAASGRRGSPTVFVAEGSPEWDRAARRYQAERGKSPPAMATLHGRAGWYFDPEWLAPPQREAVQ
jgi:hypothetical protein